MHDGPAWTQAEDAALADLIGKGKSFAQAGAEIGRSKNACISRARRIGVKASLAPGNWRVGERAFVGAPKLCKRWDATWTPEEIQILRNLRSQGKTTHEIAKAMERTYGSIRGAARRFGASVPADHQQHIQRRIAAGKPKSRVAQPDVSYANTLFGDGVSFADLQNNQCRWPVGDVDIVYCGAKRTKGSYCDLHHALAYSGRRATPLERRAVEQSMRAALVRSFS